MKYTEETISEIEKNISTGLNSKDSAELAGISESHFYVWLKKKEFKERIKKAELKRKNRLTAIVLAAAPTDWKAAMTYLERRYHDEFAQRWKGDLGFDPKKPFTFKVELTDGQNNRTESNPSSGPKPDNETSSAV